MRGKRLSTKLNQNSGHVLRLKQDRIEEYVDREVGRDLGEKTQEADRSIFIFTGRKQLPFCTLLSS